VVVAAALIMTSIFRQLPAVGDATIKSLALALAVGVACDALAVRMTIVPAVLALAASTPGTSPLARPRTARLDIEGTTLPGRRQPPPPTRKRAPNNSRCRGECSGSERNAPEDSGRCTGHLPDDIATPSGQSAAGAEGVISPRAIRGRLRNRPYTLEGFLQWN